MSSETPELNFSFASDIGRAIRVPQGAYLIYAANPVS